VTGPDDARSVARLEPLPLDHGGEGAPYDEAWLQRLIHRHPELLPIAEIEPAFFPVLPVCLELPTAKGYIDNFFITPTGNLVFVECKLWRNPQARREVVAQVMDYVESLPSLGYQGLEAAVRKAALPAGGHPEGRLYDLVADEGDLDEPAFVDAVARNLRLGRGLFLIVGDGIREEAESLTAHLQAHAGLHFALALVEMALFGLPGNGGILVQPRLLARTVTIERGIVRFDDARITVEAPERDAGEAPKTLTEEEFYQAMAARDPGLPDRLRAFLARLQPLGVEPEFLKTIVLRWHGPEGTAVNLGTVYTSGEMWTGHFIGATVRQLGIVDLARDYIHDLAKAIGGEVKESKGDPDACWVVLHGHSSMIETFLQHEDPWFAAIECFVNRVTERLESRRGA